MIKCVMHACLCDCLFFSHYAGWLRHRLLRDIFAGRASLAEAGGLFEQSEGAAQAHHTFEMHSSSLQMIIAHM